MSVPVIEIKTLPQHCCERNCCCRQLTKCETSGLSLYPPDDPWWLRWYTVLRWRWNLWRRTRHSGMRWEPADTIVFTEGGGTYEETPIGRVRISFGMNATVYVGVDGPNGYERFQLTPQAMLEGLMEHYGIPVPPEG